MPKRKRYVPPKSRHQDSGDSENGLSDDGDSSEDGSLVNLDYGNNISSDDEKEEVLPIVDDSEEEEEEDGNVEDDDESEASNEEDAVNLEAWGRKKSTYFNTDFVDEDRGKSYREEDKEAALAEEEGAFQIVEKLTAAWAPKSKFRTNVKEPVAVIKEDTIDTTADWDSMSKEQQLQALMKQSPEFIPMLREFKQMVVELKELIQKYNELVQTSKESAEPVKLKLQLMLHCAMNCSMYIVMQTRRESFRNHPLLEDLKKFKTMLKILKEQESASSKAPQPQLKKQKVVKFASDGVKDTNAAKVNERVDAVEEEEEMNADETTQEKRSVTYEIAKNKGLTPHRKKEYRNPRVRHRMKYKKALIRRKGQVRTPRTEKERYGGEISGIQPNVTKSIKFK